MMKEATIPPGRLRRLANAACYRDDPKALRALRSWRAAHPAEAEHAARRSWQLRQAFKSLDLEPYNCDGLSRA